MKVTLTLNPSLDLTYALTESSLGEVDVHRAVTSSIEASGKGVNVARTLRAAGVATLAVLPLGGATGHHLQDLLRAEGLRHRAVSVAGDTRINTSVLLAGGQTVKVNGPGPGLTDEARDQILAAVAEALREAASSADEPWLAICGSLPPGLSPDVVGDVVRLARQHEVRCAVDVSGPALDVALAAGPVLLAPNRLELAELVGADAAVWEAADVARCASELAARSGSELLVSMGADGAIYAGVDGVLHGGGPALTPVNTAGAGDAFLAGWLARPGDPHDRLATALAWGRSACLAPTTVDPAPGSNGLAGIAVDVWHSAT